MWDETRTEWDTQALLMVEAFQTYNDSLCSSCAQSAIHALNVANTREFTVDTVVCLGCNVREIWQENNGKSLIKGEKLYVVNRMGLNPPVDY